MSVTTRSSTWSMFRPVWAETRAHPGRAGQTDHIFDLLGDLRSGGRWGRSILFRMGTSSGLMPRAM